MKIGLCAGADQIELVKELGYDYIEPPLATIAALPEEEFAALGARLKRAGVRAEAFNIFFPRTIRLTGPAADLSATLTYADAALGRAAALGGQVVVFGSGGARNMPESFPPAQGWAQIVAFLRGLDPIAARHGIVIVIEHLNRGESNIITSVADGLRLSKEVNRPQIKALVDSYHMYLGQEDPAVIVGMGDHLRHVHTSRTLGRAYPTEVSDELRVFFAKLRQAGYDGRVSIEARAEDLRSDAAKALAVVRELAG